MHHDTVTSLWAHTAPAHAPNPALDEDITCDVTIIGAGFTGLRAALKLAEAGLQVTVVDAGDVGYGASGRNGGQVNPMLPFVGPEHLCKLIGNNPAERLAKAALGSADNLFSLIKTYQIDCQARQNGWLRVDHFPGAQAKAREQAKGWIELGADIEFLEDGALEKHTGSPAYKTGVRLAKGGAVQPLMLAHGLAQAAKARGARIHGQTPVTSLEQTATGWTAQTPGGNISSKWVVLATNGYTDSVMKKLRDSLLPVTSIQIATPVLTDEQIEGILPGGETIADTRRVIMYARREPDNRIVFGGHGRIGRNGMLTGFDWLMRDAVRVFPQLEDIDWQFKWGGTLAVTDDRIPHFHEPARGLLAGMGFNGRGVAMSHIMGEVMADRILGKPADELAVPVSDIKTIPFRNVKLFGKRFVVWGMKKLDQLEMK